MDTEAPARGRGRPREFDRDAALVRAMHLFWRWGYEATSLAMLTSELGITPPSLYAAFGSKEKLFLEAVERYQQSGAEITRASLAAPTVKQALQTLLLQTAVAFTEPGTPGGCLVINAATNCAPASADVEAAMRRQRISNERGLRERIQRGVESGELPEDTDATDLAKYFAVVIQGMSVQARDGASRAALEGVARAAMHVWPESRAGGSARKVRAEKPASRKVTRKPRH